MDFSELLKNKLKSYDGMENDDIRLRICNYLNKSFGITDYVWDDIRHTIKYKDGLIWTFFMHVLSISKDYHKSLFELLEKEELYQKLKILNGDDD